MEVLGAIAHLSGVVFVCVAILASIVAIGIELGKVQKWRVASGSDVEQPAVSVR